MRVPGYRRKSFAWRWTTALGGLAVLALALLVGLLKPGIPQDRSEAAIRTPGGISAMPSGGPGLANIADQFVPATAPASGPGSRAVVTIVCDDADGAAGAPIVCPDIAGGGPDGLQSIGLEITKVYPLAEPLGADFVASGMMVLVCADQATCDVSNTGGVVAVELTGGGVNEVVQVTATDESGDSRAVNIIFVETIFAIDPVSANSPIESTIISYNCPDIGAIPGDTDGDAVTLNDHYGDMDWEGLLETTYAGVDVDLVAAGIQPPAFDPVDTSQFWTCGGDSASPVDDRVYFETDAGILTVEEVADLFPFVNNACDTGHSVDVLDSPSYLGAAANLCDLDFAPNGVVSYTLALLDPGGCDVANVAVRQSGGDVLRSVTVGSPCIPTPTTTPTPGTPTVTPTPTPYPDTDGDGVPDALDSCPYAPEDADGFQDADGCPEADNDMDGICDPWLTPALPACDGSDLCPNVAEDYDGFEDADGCPEPDNDGDGFPDSTDDCPGTDWTAGPDGVPGTGDEPLDEHGVPIDTREDYDGVIDTDGCHDSPGDDYDGDGVTDDTEVFIYGTDPTNPDTDGDGCAEGEEVGGDPVLGGTRDPTNKWDFYDVPVPTLHVGGTMNDRDKAVSLFNDVLGVLEYSGTIDEGPPTSAGRDYDDDRDGDTVDDGIAYDRDVGAPWPELGVGKSHSGPPDGAVTLFDDVLLVLAQAGHSCQAAP